MPIDRPAPVVSVPDEDARWTQGLRTYVLTMLCIVGAINFIDRQVIAILVESIKADLQISDTQFGLLTGVAFAGFYIIGGIPLARIADVGVRRSLIAACTMFWSVATVLCGAANSYTTLLLARMGVAAGEAGAAPGTQSILADLYPLSQRAKIFGIMTASQAVGIAFGLFAGGWLNDHFGWRMVFLIVGAPGIIVGLLVLFTVPEPRRGMSEPHKATAAKASIKDTLRVMWSQKSYRYIALAIGALGFTGYSTLAWTPAYLIRAFGLSTAHVGLMMGAGAAAGLIIGSLVSGYLADRFGKKDERWYLIISLVAVLLSIPLGLLYMAAPTATIALFGFMIFKIAMGGIQPASLALVQSLVQPDMRATASFVITILQNIVGVALGPLVVGVLNDAFVGTLGPTAVRYSLMVTVGGLVVSAIFFALALRTLRSDLKRIRDAA